MRDLRLPLEPVPDAVYVGGAAFGARAYAKNFGEEELLRAMVLPIFMGKSYILP